MSLRPFVSELDELRTRIWRLQENTAKNANLEVTARDPRLVALSAMQESLLSCAFWLNTYQISADKEGEPTMLRNAQSNLSLPQQPLERIAKMMLDEIRLGLVVFFHFKLDDLMGCLLIKVAPKTKEEPLGLLSKFTKLSASIGLAEGQRKAEVIKAFSSIRNSLHNNGIHNKGSFSVKVGQFDYKFEKGKVVECASLPHCITLIQSTIDTVQEILGSEKVRNIKGIIPDAFA
jgi:hypothetical protein